VALIDVWVGVEYDIIVCCSLSVSVSGWCGLNEKNILNGFE